jgi:hypothetical protein
MTARFSFAANRSRQGPSQQRWIRSQASMGARLFAQRGARVISRKSLAEFCRLRRQRQAQSIPSCRQAKADMKVTVIERKDAQLLCVAGAPMVARQVIATIRNRPNFAIPFQSGMTSTIPYRGRQHANAARHRFRFD